MLSAVTSTSTNGGIAVGRQRTFSSRRMGSRMPPPSFTPTGSADQVDGHLDLDRLGERDAQEVEVDDVVGDRVVLHGADEGGVLAPVQPQAR